MTDYTPCHRASDRYDIESTIFETDWHEEALEIEGDAPDQEYFDQWLIDDLSDRAQAYEEAVVLETELSEIPFPDLIKAAEVVQATADGEF
jgi:hypothetical protein